MMIIIVYRLDAPAHVKVTKTAHQTLPGEVGSEGIYRLGAPTHVKVTKTTHQTTRCGGIWGIVGV